MAFISQLFSTEWTVLIYMAADNGLHDYAIEDIEEMELSEFGKQANIIVQMDGDQDSDLPKTYRYKVSYQPEEGIQSKVISNLGETNSGSYLTLKSFVEWGFKRYKSDHKALIVWSHANGWVKKINGKGIAPDNDSESFISMSEHQMQAALQNTNLDLLIYDACSMQTIENLTELKGRANYIIASEELVPATGLPYTQVFDYWQEAENTDSLAVNIPKIYVDSYRPGNLYNPGPNLKKITSSAVKMANFTDFEDSLNAYLLKWSENTKFFSTARENLSDFGLSYTDVDLKELLVYLSLNSSNLELADDSSQLYSEMLDVFVSHDSSSFNYKVGTASIWFPRYSYQFENNWQIYRNLNFAQGQIGNFLNKFLAPDEIPPFPFQITKSLLLNETLFLTWENHNDPDPLTYYLNFNYNDGTSQVITLIDLDSYEMIVKDSGKVYIVAEDASENRSMSETVDFELSYNYGKIYLAPNPLKEINTGTIVIYDTNTRGKEADLSIYSINGIEMGRKKIKLADGQNEHKLELNQVVTQKLSSGIYLCLVKIGNKLYKTKFAVQY
jgi:hypothetical protein